MATFTKAFAGLGQAIQAGASIGNMNLDDPGLIFTAHNAAWDSLQRDEDFNNGQYAMAEQIKGSVSDYLDGMNLWDWDADSYQSECYGATEGADALSGAIEQATAAIDHAVSEASGKIARFMMG